MLGDEAEYQEFLNSEVRSSDACSAVKLYIVPLNPMIISQTYSFDSTNIIKAADSDNFLSERFDEEKSRDLRPVPEAEPVDIVVHQENIQEELSRALEFEKVIPTEPLEEPKNFDFYHEALRVFLEQQEENERRIREEERILREREEDELAEMLTRKLEGKKKGKGKMKTKTIKPPKIEELAFVKETKPEKMKRSRETKLEEMIQPTIVIAQELSKPSEPKEKPDMDEMVMKAIEKNLERIAMMTSSFLKNQTQETQTQTLQKQEEEEKVPVMEKLLEKVMKEDERPIHRTVKCDGCGIKPLRGNRYKCSVCHNFDFCETCEQNVEHEHAFIKIKFPGQQYAHKSYPTDLANRCRITSHLSVPKKKSSMFKNKRKLEHGDLKISKLVPVTIEPMIETNFSQLKKISIFGEKKEEKLPEEVQITVEEVIQVEPEKVEEELYAPRVKEYSGLVHNKAKHMKEILPDMDLAVLLEFIDNAPEDLDLAELLENFRY